MSDAHFNPKDYINYYVSTKNITIEEIGVAPIVVGSWQAGVIKSLAEKCGAVSQDNWIEGKDKLFSTKINNQAVSFVTLRVGACTTVMQMEELIACGARTFIGLGWAGSLQSDIPMGSMIIPIDCISEEGTSAHYKQSKQEVVADSKLVTLLEEFANTFGKTSTKGTQWSTDAPYRELKSKVKKYRELGVLGVDMETSAMYALAAFREIRVCNLLVVSDELWHEWRPAFHDPKLREATKQAEDVILKCLEKISEKR